MEEIVQRNQIKVESVKIGKKEKLEGTIFLPKLRGSHPGVVFYHGRASNQRNYLPIGEELAANGICALTFNFTSDNLLARGQDARSALLFLCDHSKVDRQKVGIVGVSMGAYYAAIIASRHRAQSLILRAPAAYPVGENSPSIKAIREFRGDLLIVESEFDEIIPHEVVELYFRNALSAKRKELKVIKGAVHWLGEPDSSHRQEFKQIVVDWFTQTLK